MKRIYSAKDPLMIGHLKNVLATFGINCVARNIDLISAAGELPPIECWPELWVVDDGQKVVAVQRLQRDHRRAVFRMLELRSRSLRLGAASLA